jgi:hypothetical protein
VAELSPAADGARTATSALAFINSSIRSVRTAAGAIGLIQMPCAAYSRAVDLVRASAPAFAVV